MSLFHLLTLQVSGGLPSASFSSLRGEARHPLVWNSPPSVVPEGTAQPSLASPFVPIVCCWNLRLFHFPLFSIPMLVKVLKKTFGRLI